MSEPRCERRWWRQRRNCGRQPVTHRVLITRTRPEDGYIWLCAECAAKVAPTRKLIPIEAVMGWPNPKDRN